MASINARKIIKTAERTTGIYELGGAGGGKWDCSGFVAHCLGFQGHPFSTGEQKGYILKNYPKFKDITDSIVVPGHYDKLKPGDILIWNDKNPKDGKYGEGPNGHTAIVYKNGTLIEATSKTPVPCTHRSISYRGSNHWTEGLRPPGGMIIVKWQGN